MAGEGRRRGEDEKILTPPSLVFIPFLSLREEYFKILLSLSAKSRQPQVSCSHAMLRWMRINHKMITNIFTIML